MPFKLGSLFDGSGTCPLAATMLGIEPVWASEIEKYPVAVTTKNFPNMKHLGDITKINGAEIEPVDIITFGSPCQDLSIAGKQAGLVDGERSSLFFEAIRIMKEMWHATYGKYPKLVMWENVPGAFSSNGGADFKEVLKSLCQICDPNASVPQPKKWGNAGAIVGDGYSVAWRLMDAQYWGVPQRRRRVYAVLDLTSEHAAEILLERQGLSGDFEPCGAAWENLTAHAEGSTGGSSIAFHLQQDPISDDQVSPCIGGQHQATIGVAAFCDDGTSPAVISIEATGFAPKSLKEESWSEQNAMPALRAGESNVARVVVAIEGNGVRPSHSGVGCSESDTMYTLNTIEHHAVCYDARGNGKGGGSHQP